MMGKWIYLGLRLVPKGTMTRIAGAFLRSPMSRHFISWYALHYQIATDEAEKSLVEYRSLVEFFSRKLRPGVRTWTREAQAVLSPVDGVVSQVGTVCKGELLQIKGILYSVTGLLADPEAATRFEGGTFVTVYLSPRDYHRIHMPCSATVRRVTYIPGTFFPVNRIGAQYIPGIYTKNERVVTWFERDGQMCVMAKVGSLIVGSVQMAIACPTRPPRLRTAFYTDCAIPAQQGDELAWFEFGSTIILIFPPDCVSLRVGVGDRVQALSPMGTWMAKGTDV